MAKFLSDEEMDKLEAKSPKKVISDEEMEKLEKGSTGKDSPAEAALQGFGQAGTFGYLPNIQAATYPAMEKVFSAITGKDVEPEKKGYVELRDEFKARDEGLKTDNPYAYGTGSVAGALSTPVPGLGSAKAVGMLGKAGANVAAKPLVKGLLSAAEQGALYNPGETEGEMSGLQLGERADQAVDALKFAGGTALGIKGLQKAGKALASVPGAAKRVSDASNLHQAGYMLKDLRRLSNRKKEGLIAETLESEGLVSALGDTKNVAEKTAKKVEEAGKKLDSLYEEIGYSKASMKDAKNLTMAQKMDLDGFNPKGQFEELQAHLSNKLGDEPGGEAAVGSVLKWAEGLAKKYPDGVTPSQARALKAKADSMVNYSKMSRDLPANQAAWMEAANYIRDKIDKQANAAESVAGKELGKALKSENKRISGLLDIKKTSEDYVKRQEANSWMGLLPTVVGAGTLAGSQDLSPEGLAKAGAAALAVKGARRYGSGLLGKTASVASKASKPLEKLSPLTERGMGLIPSLERIRQANK